MDYSARQLLYHAVDRNLQILADSVTLQVDLDLNPTPPEQFVAGRCGSFRAVPRQNSRFGGIAAGFPEINRYEPLLTCRGASTSRQRRSARCCAEFDPNLWTEEGLRSSEYWEQVRQLSSSALKEFGWLEESVT